MLVYFNLKENALTAKQKLMHGIVLYATKALYIRNYSVFVN